MTATTLSDRAIRWYDANARDLPWRRAGTSGWGILVSEVMLQQTPVARVAPVWQLWLDRWPHPAALATEASGEAIRAWGRLGYPRRALRLHQCATVLASRHDNAVPADLAALLALPGVGDYTARAVAAFAFGQRHPVVDTNVRRLAARAVGGRPAGGAATSMADLVLVDGLLPTNASRAARASAAFMELGALICTARAPTCPTCPLRTVCAWRASAHSAEAGSSTGGLAGSSTGGSASVGAAPPTRPARRKQTYAGTDRQVRGLLLGLVRDSQDAVSRDALDAVWPHTEQRRRALAGLIDDGLLVELPAAHFRLP